MRKRERNFDQIWRCIIAVLQQFFWYFGFSPREIRALRVLIILFLFSVGSGPILVWLRGKPPPISVDRLRELQTFMESYTEVREGGDEMVTEPMTAFDPNTLDLQGWKKLGLTERQAHAVLGYKAKRGGFHRKEDLQKMYAMPEAVYQRIEPYLLFPQTSKKSYPDKSDVDDKAAWATILPPASENEKRRVTPPKKVWVEINTADSLELLTLTGIGPSYASRILNRRLRLGGFFQKSDLLDVYGMDSTRLGKFEAQIWIDTNAVRKISINEADYDELRRHPHIGSKLAARILRYRDQHGPFQGLDELPNVGDPKERILWDKILPFLEIK